MPIHILAEQSASSHFEVVMFDKGNGCHLVLINYFASLFTISLLKDGDGDIHYLIDAHGDASGAEEDPSHFMVPRPMLLGSTLLGCHLDIQVLARPC